MAGEPVVLTGTAHPALARAVAEALGVGLGACAVARFPDGEVAVRIEQPVRRHEVFLVQPTSPPIDSLTAVPTLCAALRERLPDDVVVVAPDAGAVRRADRYARRLGAPVAVLHKRRESGTETAVTHVVSDTPLLAAALRRFLADGSIGDLF